MADSKSSSTTKKTEKTQQKSETKTQSTPKRDFSDILNKEYTRSFSRALRDTLEVEGVFSDHEDDSGGKTKFGITEALARHYGYTGNMKDLTKEEATAIYYAEFWSDEMQKIAGLYEPLAKELFDTSVNMGKDDAVEFFQTLLNSLNLKEEIYDDIKVDGILGKNTVSAFVDYKEYRKDEGCMVLTRAMNCLQGYKYAVSLPKASEKFESFVYGWLLNRVSFK